MDHDASDMKTTSPQTTLGTSGLRVALFGLGTVGTAVAGRLLDPAWGAEVAARGHRVPRLVGVADLDLERERGLSIPDDVRQVTDYQELLGDEVDVVIELIGGAGVAGDAVLAAFAAGKSVVTANKDLVARRGRELEAAARDGEVSLRFEAAVLAGVPVLGPLVEELTANRVDQVRGIFNGTTNYILSTMAADAREYHDVLVEAQARGFAEADPSSDVEGYDAAYKLVLLSRLAWGGWADVDAVRRSLPLTGGSEHAGIMGLERSHMSAAARLGMAIKLIARVERLADGALRGGVTPMAVAASSTIGSTHGVTNVIEISAEPVGRVAMRGPGAGGAATSSAILADVLALSRGGGSTWAQLPPAADIDIADDLAGEQGWLVVVQGLGVAGFSDAIRELALATTDEGFVTAPIRLTELMAKLGPLEHAITVYPILADA